MLGRIKKEERGKERRRKETKGKEGNMRGKKRDMRGKVRGAKGKKEERDTVRMKLEKTGITYWKMGG